MVDVIEREIIFRTLAGNPAAILPFLDGGFTSAPFSVYNSYNNLSATRPFGKTTLMLGSVVLHNF
ncbi:unnamed protein product, partial [marine sediment metagenome]